MDATALRAALHAAIRAAEAYQDGDTGHPSFCEVPNRTVTDIIDRFRELDAAMRRGDVPHEWRIGRVPGVQVGNHNVQVNRF